MGIYIAAYEKLKRDYQIAAQTEDSLNHYSPVKKVRVLNSIHGIPTVTLTKMHGEAIDGFTVDKTILVNDEVQKTDDDVVLSDERHHVAERFHNVGLTRLRCGLMTCVALEEAMRLLGITEIKRIGFFGNGRTNIQNAECLHDIFGIRDFVIRGSAKNRAKNLDSYLKITDEVTVDDTEDLALLNSCDAVISCTSTCKPADQISAKQLYGPRIMIALDTGYLFDESFRQECDSFSDDVDQLEAYYQEEFIFDRQKYPLKQLMAEKVPQKSRLCVYMFGISFADAEIAEMVYRHEVDTEK